ncbi:MAG: radical SAM family heme chaperone HemW [Parachlamydiaceae bacterium]
MTGNPIVQKEEISLYFHIPFCTRKCDYCHFYVLPNQEKPKQQLAEGFQLEWALFAPYLINKKIVTIYFGGGTPSLFGPARIASILKMIKGTCEVIPSAEITLEANPENITLELMQGYAESGINRVSIGIQTLDSILLKLIGRLHSAETALHAINTTLEAGISNISIDLMYDLPKQTVDHWSTTLKALESIPIQHLSLYNLTIEPHTVFFKKQAQLRPLLPNEEESLEMYEMAIQSLEKRGLYRYEISAFARPGFESQHNTGYWKGRQFLGLGPSAFSYWEKKRFRNIAHLGKYCSALREGQFPKDFEELLDLNAQRRELFVIQIRLKQGVEMNAFTAQHGPLDPITQQTLLKLIEEEFLMFKHHSYLLTHKGILFYDTIAAELI